MERLILLPLPMHFQKKNLALLWITSCHPAAGRTGEPEDRTHRICRKAGACIKKTKTNREPLRRLRYTGGSFCLGYCFGVRRNHVQGCGCGPAPLWAIVYPNYRPKSCLSCERFVNRPVKFLGDGCSIFSIESTPFKMGSLSDVLFGQKFPCVYLS
mgnify:CR=1 FL=1